MRIPKVKPGSVPEPRGARPDRWHGHRQARRAELVASAIEAIRTRGAGVGMDEIAAQAGVSKPILYRHFTDRADLWLAVGKQVTDELLLAMSTQLSVDRPPRETIAGVIDTYLALIEEDTDIYRFVVHGSFADRGLTSELVHTHMALMAEQVARVLGDRLRDAGVDSGGAEPWAHGMVGMVQAAADWWIDRRSMSRGALVAYLTSMICNGIEGLVGGDAADALPLSVHSAYP
ncbi:MAG: TetR/AcrR family transcriptional regulator [Candidatus Dormibacteraeota bacterium]|uniref:TetR/AcrR family transcriptional regulator n=1 Tax=Candidatus Amunia macphersoniae TaxID=3127014 RepID=A0A934KR63_9BACT|nr:TetR/AcrR family transcriptional regulator [Candidatus Dormibacteraeota bacterium]